VHRPAASPPRRAVRAALAPALLAVLQATLPGAAAQELGDYGPRARDEMSFAPEWEVSNPAMKHDVFTFARLEYSSRGRGRGRWRGGGGWRTDWPDSDLNFSWRLSQLTALEVNPDPVVVSLSSDDIFEYPFLYMIEPGGISLSGVEVENLRKYLLNGGFLMVDDFWGDYEWDDFYQQMKVVLPGREPVPLPLNEPGKEDHAVFSAVFVLKEKPQVPSIDTAIAGRASGITYEWSKPGAETPHYYGYFDDQGRMMCIVCHNTDLGDGWEREGENHWYFKEFSEKLAYPMGINIVFYAMTH
jgi:hypothetical protein